MRTKLLALLLLTVLFAACGGDGTAPDEDAAASPSAASVDCPEDYSDAEVYPIFVSSEVVAGQENRFLLGLLDKNDAPIASPDLQVEAVFEQVQPAGQATTEASFGFILTDPRSGRGLYVAQIPFASAGTWAADVSVKGGPLDTSVRGCFEVAEQSLTPAVGAPAPASETATAKPGEDLSKISTDENPVSRFYEVSIAEAVKAKKPFVVTFATPKYCSSQVCGPTLDIVKSVAKDHPETTFIHTEIYEGLEPQNPPLPAVMEWGLPSEPWVFVVDAKGRVAAKFEGTVSPQELRNALAQVS